MSEDQPIPTITNEHVDQQIKTCQFYRFPGTNVIVCCLTLRNGFAVVGQSSCVHPALFNEDTGKQIAFNNARNAIWELEGYLLKDFLHSQENPPVVIERVPGGDSTGLPD